MSELFKRLYVAYCRHFHNHARYPIVGPRQCFDCGRQVNRDE